MAKKVKVLYVIERLARAGTELHLLQLLRHLNREKFEPVLCCLSRENTDQSLLPSDMPCYQLSGKWNLFHPRSVRLFSELRHLIKTVAPDIVHSYLFVANTMCPYALSGKSRPGLVLSRGRMGIEWEANWLHRLLQRKADQRCQAILCKTQAMAEEIQRVEGVRPDKIRVTPNGVDVAYFQRLPGSARQCREDLHREFGVPLEGPLLLSVGNLKPIKGHALMVEAAYRLRDGEPAPVWVLLGDGESRADLEKLAASYGLSGRLFMPGSFPDVRPWMAAADLFVAPSHSEGLPNAVLEAMAMGLPLLLSDIPGHRETAGESGCYFTVGDAEALAKKTLELLADETGRKEMERKAWERVSRNYSQEAMLAKIEGLYLELADLGRNV